MAKMMRAILVREFGSPDVCKLSEIPIPKLGENQVRWWYHLSVEITLVNRNLSVIFELNCRSLSKWNMQASILLTRTSEVEATPGSLNYRMYLVLTVQVKLQICNYLPSAKGWSCSIWSLSCLLILLLNKSDANLHMYPQMYKPAK